MIQMEAPEQVPSLTFTVENFNPNHKVRFFAFSDPISSLFDLSGSVSNDSIYLAPLLAHPVIIHRSGETGIVPLAVGAPSEDVHLSFHEDGAVNIHAGAKNTRIRSRTAGRPSSGLLTRLVFNSLSSFHTISTDEFNALPQRFLTIPIIGLWGSVPICLDIYLVDTSAPWVMPNLADILQMDVYVKPEGKTIAYHFLVWQHSKAKHQPSDLTVYYSPTQLGNEDLHKSLVA